MISSQLTKRILLALLFGALFGLLLHPFTKQHPWLTTWVIDGALLIVGKWFIALLMVMVVPLVFVSLSKGVAQLGGSASLGKLSGMTMAFYVLTTPVAISIGIGLAHFFQVGSGLNLVATETVQTADTPSFVDLLISLIPTNPIAAMAEGNMLQVIVFAILFGLALSTLNSVATSQRLLAGLDVLESVFIRMVGLVMLVAPIGVFALMARSLSSQGWDVFAPLMVYFMVIVLALSAHVLVVYASVFKLFTGLSPIQLARHLKDVWTVSFSTSSSAATLPVTLETTQRMGVSPKVHSFTIPLGATINMDGTAIMQGVATVFIANAYGIDLSMGDYVLVMITATLASIGTAAVPGAGLIMLTMVLTQVGLPVEGIALILSVDRLLDMFRTSVNVTGDVVVTSAVASQLQSLDKGQFADSLSASRCDVKP